MEIEEIYKELKLKYGKPAGQWSFWCKRPKTFQEKERVIIESILTQRANWKNVQLTVDKLSNTGKLSLKEILNCKQSELELLIKSSVFFRIKAERLKIVADYILNKCGGIKKIKAIDTDSLRQQLLSLKGVGDETADSILLYAFERAVFVIDEYTKRLVKEKNLTNNLSYGNLQQLFETSLNNKDYILYQDFHALIVINGKTTK
ncbi:hypothetical protein M0P98_06815 [bacterium]|nr:hypothetical protein [bacterium]